MLRVGEQFFSSFRFPELSQLIWSTFPLVRNTSPREKPTATFKIGLRIAGGDQRMPRWLSLLELPYHVKIWLKRSGAIMNRFVTLVLSILALGTSLTHASSQCSYA